MSEKVLIISLGELKDIIYTLPLLSVLKQNDYTVDYLTSEKGFEIVQGNPIVDRVFLVPLEQWSKKMPYWGIFEDISGINNKLKKREYDIAIDCQQTFRSLPFIMGCGAKRRLSYSNASEFSFFGANEFIDRGNLKNNNIHIVEKNLNFARYLNLDTSKPEFFLPESKFEAKQKIDRILKNNEDTQILLLAPDMMQGESSWHPKNWIHLVNNLPQKYTVVVVGNAYDNSLANKMSHKNLINLCSKTNLDDIRYLISISKYIISNKLDVSAIAWAMNSDNIITISTNYSPALYSPYDICNKNKTYISMSGNLDCQPCNKKTCTNNYKCSLTPNVETILQSIV